MKHILITWLFGFSFSLTHLAYAENQAIQENIYFLESYKYLSPQTLYTSSTPLQTPLQAWAHIMGQRTVGEGQNIGKKGAVVGTIALLPTLLGHLTGRDGQRNDYVMGALLGQLSWISGFAEKITYLGESLWGLGRWILQKSHILAEDKPDTLLEFEIQLALQWDTLAAEIRSSIAETIFEVRLGHASFSKYVSYFNSILHFPTEVRPFVIPPEAIKNDPLKLHAFYHHALLDLHEKEEEALQGFEDDTKTSLLAFALNRARASYSGTPSKTARTFSGPPGTGKTEAAKAFAGPLTLPTCLISLSGKTVADLEGRNDRPGEIASCFLKTQVLNPIIIFDDADRKMNQATPGGTNDMVGYFLDLINEKTTEVPDYYLKRRVNVSYATFLYTTNQRIQEMTDGAAHDIEAYYQRAPEIPFNGFSPDYRLSYINNTYIPQLIAQNPGLSLTSEDFAPYVKEWYEAQTVLETRFKTEHILYDRGMRSPLGHFGRLVDEIFLKRNLRSSGLDTPNRVPEPKAFIVSKTRDEL